MMADKSELRFTNFLRSFDRACSYQLIRLSGGLINETVRAIADAKSDAARYRSLVLKYAPPFVAAVGPSAPFGQERQVGKDSAILTRMQVWIL